MSPANQHSFPEILAEGDEVDDAALAEAMRTVPLEPACWLALPWLCW
jgi:hypothetical protein